MKPLALYFAALATVGLALHAPALRGQNPVTAAPRPATTAAPGDILPAQPIGPDDLLSLQVSDIPELSRTFRVSSDGTLKLPLIDHRLKVAGLMPVDIENSLAAELKAAGILVDPVVSVGVVDYRSRPVSVVGAVKNPLTFEAMSDSTLLDAIAKAGGLAPEAGPVILLSRKGDSEIQRIPTRGLIDAADPALNVRLKGGEEVRIPEVGKIFITGNVKLPGAYPMQDNSDTTLLKALALSQGTLPYSQKKAYIYRRDVATNQRKEIPVELKQIMARKSPDITIQPDDIIYIPENHGQKLTANALDRIAGTGSSVAAAMAYHY
jgi:polysaccharide export outer membrane protein